MIDDATLDSPVVNRQLKKFQLIANMLSLGMAIITASGIGYAFYYKTNDKLEQHSTQIEKSEVEVKDLKAAVHNSAVFQAATAQQMKALEDRLYDVRKSQERIEDKIDELILRGN